MKIEELKKGDKIIYQRYYWSGMTGYKTLIVEEVLKTKIKTQEKLEISKKELNNVLLYTNENLEIVKEKFIESVKNDVKQKLKGYIGLSSLKLTAYELALQEIKSELNGKVI